MHFRSLPANGSIRSIGDNLWSCRGKIQMKAGHAQLDLGIETGVETPSNDVLVDLLGPTVIDEPKGAVYTKNWVVDEVPCERLVLDWEYTSASLTLETKDTLAEVSFPAATLNFRQFAASVDAHAQSVINGRGYGRAR
jgi:hypothetical protein